MTDDQTNIALSWGCPAVAGEAQKSVQSTWSEFRAELFNKSEKALGLQGCAQVVLVFGSSFWIKFR